MPYLNYIRIIQTLDHIGSTTVRTAAHRGLHEHGSQFLINGLLELSTLLCHVHERQRVAVVRDDLKRVSEGTLH